MNLATKKIYLYLFALLLSCGSIVFAENTHPVSTALADKYGQILSKDLEGMFEFTVSAEFSEIKSILEIANAQEWYVNHVSISSRSDGKAAIIFKVSQQKNDSASKFSRLQNILQPGMLIWKTDKIPDNMPVVTTIETSFSPKIIINGVTRKSSLIFSHLFPMIERANELRNPFFARGTYSDTEDGRVMNFAIDCDW